MQTIKKFAAVALSHFRIEFVQLVGGDIKSFKSAEAGRV